MKLKDKVVLVTDGGSPTGKAIAARLAQEGALVALNIAPDAQGTGSDAALVTHANPADTAAVEGAVNEALGKFGRIDVVVHNNASVAPRGLEDCDDAAYDAALDINLKSAFLFVRAAAASMKKARKGSFVFISSIHDEKPNGFDFAYSLAKGGIKMLTKEMVLELGPYGIRTNLINAGPLEGEERLFYSKASPFYEQLEYRIAGAKAGSREDLAQAVLFFAGDDCPYANGAELRLDGGMVLSYYQRPVSDAFDIEAMEAEE